MNARSKQLKWRRSFGIVAMAILLLVVSAKLVLGAEVNVSMPLQLKANIVVTSDQITFADLFQNAGELSDIVVAGAPLPGRKLSLSPLALARNVAAHGREWTNTGQLRRILVKRSGRRLGRMEIADLLKTELDQTGNGARYELVVSAGASNIYVPGDAMTLPQVERLDVNPSTGAFMATMVPYANAEAVTLRGRAWHLTEVPALVRPIAAGQMIAADDVVWIDVRADRLGVNPILDEAQIVGQMARRSLAASRALKAHDLKTPDAVKKGELISIVYELPGLKLTARGKVLANAATGDTVRVVNLSSSRTIEVTITGPGTAVAIPTQLAGG
jgi:flagella basal body P-ring formation protein FlgA